jgi:hypothetical protein
MLVTVGDKLQVLFNFANSEEYTGYHELVNLGLQFKSDVSLVISPDDDAFYVKNYSNIMQVHDQELPRLHALLSDSSKNILALTQQYAELSRDLEVKQKLLSFYQALLDKTSVYYLDALSGMLTEVYQKVYDDVSAKVLLEMQEYRGKKIIKLRIVKLIEDKSFVEELTAQGGSCQNILGMMIQVYCILNLGLPRTILLDEILSSLSNSVLANLLGIFEKLRDEMGFSFLIIDHSIERFSGFINNLYTIERGIYKQVLDIDKFVADVQAKSSYLPTAYRDEYIDEDSEKGVFDEEQSKL